MTIFKVGQMQDREMLAKQIGRRLKQAREDRRLTQEEIGAALGIERAAYANIETGRSLLTIEHLMKLPGILLEPVTYFLGVETELSVDEGGVLEAYRATPDGLPKQHAKQMLRSWADQFLEPAE